jgi:hypothetical protein
VREEMKERTEQGQNKHRSPQQRQRQNTLSHRKNMCFNFSRNDNNLVFVAVCPSNAAHSNLEPKPEPEIARPIPPYPT